MTQILWKKASDVRRGHYRQVACFAGDLEAILRRIGVVPEAGVDDLGPFYMVSGLVNDAPIFLVARHLPMDDHFGVVAEEAQRTLAISIIQELLRSLDLPVRELSNVPP